ncbi:FYVE and coiled-coil domain-containing protein 1-like [Heptranchias perlo]|uniref:FYVE and coiled-coil domain-containing protein 1-like n=1 Tax=Heptranchias perlo TaxID=212740 RepID=UPI003559BADD
MAGNTDIQLLKVIKDLQSSIQELCEDHERNQLPITDASPALHRLCTRLEYLLQYDQKEKKTIFGSRKDYWDYFCMCLNSHKCGTDGLKFINYTPRLNTSLGKGRAFIRYCLVQQQLADSLQLCFLNQQLASDWYYASSPFLSERLRSDITAHLYSLNGITFDLAIKGVDLDTSWPSGRGEFKTPRRTSGSEAPSNKPLKEKYKNTNNGPEKNTKNQKPVIIRGIKESMKSVVQGIPSGASASHGASQSSSKLRVSEEPILGMSAESDGSRSIPGQLVQSEQDVPMLQHEKKNVGLVSNLEQVSNGSAQPRERGQVDAQRCEEFVTTLTAGEKREIELKVKAEQQSLIEKLNRDLKEKEHVIEEFKGLLKEKEKIHREESSKLQQEVSNLREMQRKSEEQSNRVGLLEDSNKFLNETIEEMDSILDGVKQAMVEKDHENMLLKKEQEEKMSEAQQVHKEELEKLKLELREHQKEHDEMKQDTDERQKKVMEQLKSKESTLAAVQSEKEQEQDKLLAEMEKQRSKLQCLESLNNSLEEKHKESQQKVKDLQVSVISLQSEVSRLQASEKQLLQQSSDAILSPDGKELKLREDNGTLEEDPRKVQMQNELVNQKLEKCQLERDERAQGKTMCSDSLTALKQEYQQAQVQISDLGQQLAKYKEQELTSKSPVEENANTVAKKGQDLKVLMDKLEEITQKLESSNAEKSETERKLEETIAQLHILTAERSSTENWSTELKGQYEVLAEETKTKLATFESSQVEMAKVQNENAELKCSLQEISKENESAQRKLTSVLSALEESTQELARVEKQMEELENSRGSEVQRMKERIEAIRAETETLEQQKEELKQKASTLDEELLQLKESAAKLVLGNTKAKAEMERAQAEVEQLRTQMVHLSSEKVALEQKVATMGQQQQDDERQSQVVLQSELESAREGKERAQGQLSSLAKENEELHAELQATREQVSSLQRLMAQESSDFEQGMAKKTAEHDRLTEALNEDLLTGRKDIQYKADELKSKDAELLSLAESLAQAKRVEEDLKETLKKAQKDAKSREEEFHHEIQDLREMVRSLKEKTVELLREKDVLWQKSDELEFNQRQSDHKRSSRRDRFSSKKGL